MPLLLYSHSIPDLPRATPSSSSGRIHQKPFFLSSSSLNPSTRFTMSSSHSLPPLPEHRTVVGCGSVAVDFLAAVASYPKPDDKIRSTSLKIQGGGNAGNALTCAARLGLNPRLISKVANDSQGRAILEELEADGVDTSFFVVSEEGNSPFTYIIVDNEKIICEHLPAELPRDCLTSHSGKLGPVYIPLDILPWYRLTFLSQVWYLHLKGQGPSTLMEGCMKLL